MPKPSLASRELTAFISSTYVDLRPFRERVEEALARIEAGFRSMKFFGSKEGDPLDECLSKVRQCNYYIGIIGHRYGQIHDREKKSITELEYEEARRLRMSRRIYFACASIEIRAEHVESDENRRLLEDFKQKLKKENTIVEFSSPDDLAAKVLADIVLGLPERSEITTFARDKYLPAVRAACASISFLGLDIQSMKRHKDVKLEKVYVKSKFGPLVSTGKLPTALSSVAETVLAGSQRSAGQEIFELDDLFLARNDLIVLGDPGSGKTTLAKYLVVSFADKAHQVSSGLNGSIPVRVPLRAYAEYRQQSGGVGKSILDFLRDFAKTELQLDSLPDAFFEFYLERKKAVLIFDGLDEIFNSHLREQVKNDIVAFTQGSHPGNRVLVASRKFGYEEAAFPETEFTHFLILPFDKSQISEYVKKWYSLEETDQRKRKEEMAAFHKASENLPQELLSNPLLLSLIVILFRSGCSLPESKLEIYRSCVGTLTEKWDAAGKRLDLPPEYNLVRDKKGAFARIAYWMYKQLSEEEPGQVRLKYPQIVGELTRFLCERDFRDREADAQQAAEFFLEYAAKRSIFVEDRFSHKTFHEYFAALYLYRAYCFGRLPDDLYEEIKPYLSSNNWAVALELLLLMIDEHAAPLVERIFGKIVGDVCSSPDQSYSFLLVPLRTIGELQNVSLGSISSIISTAVNFCAKPRSTDASGGRFEEEAPHQRVYGVLSDLPEKYLGVLEANLRKVALAARGASELASVAAFCAEVDRPGWPKVEEIVPEWDSVKRDLAKYHLGLFYRSTMGASVVDRLRRFLSLYGRERLFSGFPLTYRPSSYYLSVADNVVYLLSSQPDEASYAHSVRELLDWELADYLLEGLVSGDSPMFWHSQALKTALNHLMLERGDPRTYLVDWLVLARSVKSWGPASPAERIAAIRRLRGVTSTRGKVRAFYAALLLGSEPPDVSADELGIKAETFANLQRASKKQRHLRRPRNHSPK